MEEVKDEGFGWCGLEMFDLLRGVLEQGKVGSFGGRSKMVWERVIMAFWVSVCFSLALDISSP